MTTPINPAVNTTGTDATALLPELADTAKVHWWKRSVLWLVIGALLLAAIAFYLWQKQRIADTAPSFTTEAVSKGDLTLTVTANGTLQPTRSVNIGSELSGTVSRVLVDVNDVIKKGQVLVELDTAKLNDQVVRSRAALASVEATVALAAATEKEAKGNLARLEQVASLSGGKVPSGTELDTGRATLERAMANELSARANVVSAKATLSTDVTNLSKASIRAPADGVILTRTVDPGNAVAASLQAVTLFVIAEDLRKLRLQVNVDEADVGSVKTGQKARFTVSAYANRQYPAAITRVAFGSTITENVVTYITYLDVDNADLSLRPGMTATANIVADERHDVLLVPNTALRFTPSQTARVAANKGIVASLMPRGPSRAPRRSAASAANVSAARQVWVLRDGTPVAVSVTPGISNGKMTEITTEGLQVGMQVITDQHSTSAP